ncbi:MAG: YheC/YheD family protein [Gracilibacteraceae bacterium]|jgi:hypothetical protein|nr:YheC/YheD family protein [Gracilibacteraceae bacterium]
MITVGKLWNVRKMHEGHKFYDTYTAICHMANHFDIDLFFFSPEDVDIENMTIDALFLERSRQVRRKVRIPAIVDDSADFANNKLCREIAQKLKRYTILVQPFAGYSKMKTYQLLREGDRFKELLIPTAPVKTIEDLESLLGQYDGRLFMKPRNGSGGRGAFMIEITRGQYKLHAKRKKTTFSSEDFPSYFHQNIAPLPGNRYARYLAQPVINSERLTGEACDVRIHVQRGAGGAFTHTSFVRIGHPEGIVSNLAGGGYLMPAEGFLRNEFGKSWRGIYAKLEEIAIGFPEYWQSLIPVTTANIGIDVGIQKTLKGGSFHIFEINSHCGMVFPHIQAFRIIQALLEYYHHLYDNFAMERNIG